MTLEEIKKYLEEHKEDAEVKAYHLYRTYEELKRQLLCAGFFCIGLTSSEE